MPFKPIVHGFQSIDYQFLTAPNWTAELYRGPPMIIVIGMLTVILYNLVRVHIPRRPIPGFKTTSAVAISWIALFAFFAMFIRNGEACHNNSQDHKICEVQVKNFGIPGWAAIGFVPTMLWFGIAEIWYIMTNKKEEPDLERGQVQEYIEVNILNEKTLLVPIEFSGMSKGRGMAQYGSISN